MTTHITQGHNKLKMTKTANPAKSKKKFVSGYDTMPDIEDLERIVDRELKKLEEIDNVSTEEK